jgi:hypothetical protein
VLDITILGVLKVWRVLGGFFSGVGLTFILTLLFGNGAYWQYRESTLKTDQAQRERITKIIELRDKQLDTLQKILENSAKHTEAQDSFLKTGDYKSQNEILRIKAYIESLRGNYRELEKDLSQLEGRPVKDINLDFFTPLPPSQLEIGLNPTIAPPATK